MKRLDSPSRLTIRPDGTADINQMARFSKKVMFLSLYVRSRILLEAIAPGVLLELPLYIYVPSERVLYCLDVDTFLSTRIIPYVECISTRVHIWSIFGFVRRYEINRHLPHCVARAVHCF